MNQTLHTPIINNREPFIFPLMPQEPLPVAESPLSRKIGELARVALFGFIFGLAGGVLGALAVERQGGGAQQVGAMFITIPFATMVGSMIVYVNSQCCQSGVAVTPYIE